MEAARVAAMRGHEVTLIEKGGELGGNLIPGGSHTFKKEVRDLNAWYRQELAALPVDIQLNTEADAAMLNAMGADYIVLATGSTPIRLDLPVMDDTHVVGCLEALVNPDKIGKKVVVIGGGLVGSEMALEYGKEGKDVTVVEALPRILSSGIPNPVPNAQMIPDLFDKYGVKVLENHKLTAIKSGKVIMESDSGTVELDADSVVMAVGFHPASSIAEKLTGCGAVVYEIGDARSVATILQAVWDGFEVGNNI